MTSERSQRARAAARGTRIVVACLAMVAGVAAPAVATADDNNITVGLFAPTAPFEGTGDKVSFISNLASHLSAEAGGKTVKGKVYSNAGSFSSAVKRGEVQFAVIDGPYAAALGLPYKMLAAAVKDGSSTVSWQLVAAAGITRLKDLEGKKVVVPSIGAKEQAFVTNSLLDGEVDAGFFDKIVEASDPNGAVTMVSVGKADAAFVPSGTSLPGGVTKIMSLGQVGLPMFVSLPGNEESLVKKFSTRVKSFDGGGAFSGFTSADAGKYRSLSGSFGKSTKKGPMAVPPPARLTVRDILEGRKFSIPISDVLTLVEAPKAPKPKPRPTTAGAGGAAGGVEAAAAAATPSNRATSPKKTAKKPKARARK